MHLVRRLVAAPLILLLAAVVVAACGSSSSSSSTSTAAAALTTKASDPSAARELPASIRTSGVLRIATEVGYAPFEFYGPDGTTVDGLDVDLWNALKAELGLNVKINDGTYADIVPALEAGRDDVGWSAMALVSFVGLKSERFLIYADRSFNDLVVNSQSSIHGATDLCGKTLGYTGGESANTVALDAKCKASGKPPVGIKRFEKTPDIILGIESGQVDGRIVDPVNGHYFVSQSQGKLRYVPDVLPREVVPTGIAVPVGQPGLLHVLQAGLQKLIDNGTYGRILAKWDATEVAVKHISVIYDYHG